MKISDFIKAETPDEFMSRCYVNFVRQKVFVYEDKRDINDKNKSPVEILSLFDAKNKVRGLEALENRG